MHALLNTVKRKNWFIGLTFKHGGGRVVTADAGGFTVLLWIVGVLIMD